MSRPHPNGSVLQLKYLVVKENDPLLPSVYFYLLTLLNFLSVDVSWTSLQSNILINDLLDVFCLEAVVLLDVTVLVIVVVVIVLVVIVVGVALVPLVAVVISVMIAVLLVVSIVTREITLITKTLRAACL